MKNLLALICLITSPFAMGLEAFCFSSQYSLSQIKDHVQIIASPKDKIYLRESQNCLEVATSSSKVELMRKWISKKYPILKSYTVGQQVAPSAIPSNCRLAVEKEVSGSNEVTTAAIGQRNRLNQQTSRTSGKSVSSLVLGMGSSGVVSVNGQRVELECLQSGAAGLKIKVSLVGPRQEIATQLVVNKGVRTNLGSVVEDLNRQSRSAGFPSGVSVSKSSGSLTYDYYLLAK